MGSAEVMGRLSVPCRGLHGITRTQLEKESWRKEISSEEAGGHPGKAESGSRTLGLKRQRGRSAAWHPFLLLPVGMEASSPQVTRVTPAPAATPAQSNTALTSRPYPGEGPFVGTKPGVGLEQTSPKAGERQGQADLCTYCKSSHPWQERNIADRWAEIHGLQGSWLKSLWSGAGHLPSAEHGAELSFLSPSSSLPSGASPGSGGAVPGKGHWVLSSWCRAAKRPALTPEAGFQPPTLHQSRVHLKHQP